jgi:LysR family transcriptional regulator for metE and metH
MFDIKHLRTLSSLEKTGSIKKTAEALFSSQSALSHQIKDLEQRLCQALFIRNTSPIEFTEHGRILLDLANRVLPEIELTKQKLNGYTPARKTLRLAIACHACFQWLLPVIEKFNKQQTMTGIEFHDEFFSNNNRQKVDLLFTDEKDDTDGFIYQTIGKFEVVAVLAYNHKKSHQSYLIPQDFVDEILLTYPINPQQLDVFTLFLDKKKCQPKSIKQVNNSHTILQMVAAEMGIATMPSWLVNSLSKQSLVQNMPLGKQGVFKTLYARYSSNNKRLKSIEQLLPLAQSAFIELDKTDVKGT